MPRRNANAKHGGSRRGRNFKSSAKRNRQNGGAEKRIRERWRRENRPE